MQRSESLFSQGCGQFLFIIGLMAAVVVAFSSRSEAAPMLEDFSGPTLQTLIDQGSEGVQVGELRFFNFSYVPNQSIGSPSAPTASEVAVSSAATGLGLRFVSLWQAENGSFQNAQIAYEVEVVGGAPPIDGVGLVMNGVAINPAPFTFVTVTEALLTLNTSPPPLLVDVGTLSTVNDGPAGLPNNNSDFLAVSPTSYLQVSKAIGAQSGEGGRASVSVVENTFTQIPEPAVLGLLALALPLLGRGRRRT